MNANYLYDVFAYCGEHDLPDLTIALAMLQAEKLLPEGMTDGGTAKFIGRHYNALVEAYAAKDRELFAAAVAKCEQSDLEAEKE